jgi:sigma-E factor negative regulatory protein RseA
MKERISALMDGELDAKSAAQLIESLPQDPEALQAWRAYHVIGDALREGRVSAGGIAARVAARLAEEPTVMAPRALAPESPRRWVALPIAASFAAVALVGWLAFAPQQEPAASKPALAQAPEAPAKPQVVVQVPLPSAARDYLLAHQGVSPRMSLQGMAPYARTVSHEVQEARR